MLSLKGFFIKLAIAIKVFFIAQLLFPTVSYARPDTPVIHLEMPNASWWNKVANSQSINDLYFDAAQHLSGLKTLAQVRVRMIKLASKPIHIAIQKSNAVNVFAREVSGYNLIIFTTGFIRQFGNDVDVLAITLGHEMAHHHLGHINNKPKIVGLVRPESNYPRQAKTGKATETQRNELDADQAGIEYATHAGYSACGGYRLFSYLQKNEIKGDPDSISSHPHNSERIDLANELNIGTQKTPCS